MNKFIIVREIGNENRIKYINLNNVISILPTKKYTKKQQYEVYFYTIYDRVINGLISYETAEELFEHFQFEGEIIDE